MQKVIPVITNVDSNLYYFLKSVIYEERGGPFHYCFSFLWMVAMMLITLMAIWGMSAIDAGYLSGVPENAGLYSSHITLPLMQIFNYLTMMFLAYVAVGCMLDLVMFPLYEHTKDWL